MRKYAYITIDDEQKYREQVKEMVEEFNKSPQKQFVETFGERVELELLAEHDGFTNNRLLSDMNQADIVFLDLRFDGIEAGIDYLIQANARRIKNIVVLTNYKADYEKKAADFPSVLGWLHKPLSLENLENVIEKFHIAKEGVTHIYRKEYLEIIGRKNQYLFYKDITFVRSSGGAVYVYGKGFEEKTYSANILNVKGFVESVGFCKISSSCALNLDFNWTCYEDKGSPGTHYAYIEGLKSLEGGYREAYFKIQRLFTGAVIKLSNRTSKET